MAAIQDQVTLTQEEQELFDTLLAAASHAGTNTVLRAAGGWVRDKLLGKDSPDIDIALDNMLGKDFAEKVNEYLVSQGKEVRTAAVIHSNPEQSKHLETARMKINNMWIDLVNLRSEAYADGSRIPTMEFGTPEQDAQRRDFTINALFYNLNTRHVEDFTGRGLDDLRAGILRTPLPASDTFRDDPLRVLRAVRFATRFSFELDSAILEAAASDVVRKELGSKVSRERVGTELDGMFNGKSPSAAVHLLHRLRLFPAVFTPPADAAPLLGDDWGAACASCIAAAQVILEAQDTQLDKDERRALLLSALTLPLRRLTYKAKNRDAPASAFIVRESLKWRTKDAEAVVALHEGADTLAGLAHELAQGSPPGSASADVRIRLGHAIRTLKSLWPLGAMLAPLVTLLPAARPRGVEPLPAPAAASGLDASGVSPQAPTASSADADAEGAAAQRHLAVARELVAAAHAFELADCWKWRALVDGNTAMRALGMKRGGKQLGSLLAAAMEWQLAHPRGTTEECLQHLRGTHTAEEGS